MGTRFLCTLCDGTFSRYDSLNRHRQSIHPVAEDIDSDSDSDSDSDCKSVDCLPSQNNYSSADLDDAMGVQLCVVRESHITDRQDRMMSGVFSLTDIPVDTCIGWYRGNILTLARARSDEYVSDYVLQLGTRPFWISSDQFDREKMICVDATPNTHGYSHILPYINSVRNIDTNRRTTTPNVRFEPNGQCIIQIAIAPGTELLVDYGEEFFWTPS